jgi:hypothetical protein
LRAECSGGVGNFFHYFAEENGVMSEIRVREGGNWRLIKRNYGEN